MSERDPQRERRWRAVVSEWKQSGQTARAFCRDRKLNVHTLYGWHRELRRRDGERTISGTSTRRHRVVQVHVTGSHQVGAQVAEPPAQPQHPDDLDGVQRRRIGRRRVDELPGELGHLHHRQAELRVDVRVGAAELGDLASRAVAVRPTAQRPAVGQRRERALQGNQFKPVPGPAQVAD